MVETGATVTVSRIAIQLSVTFAIVGIALLYLAIAITDASEPVKVLWASGLSLTLATVFLMVWSMARDASRQQNYVAGRTH